MKRRVYELRIVKIREKEIGLSFAERTHQKDQSIGSDHKEFRMWGTPVKVMTETLLNALKKEGYRTTEFSAQRTEPFIFREAFGVKLGLLFYTLKPLKKPSRMEEIITGVDRMSDEEAYYWFAKCNSGKATRAQKALRILLAGE